MQLIEEDITDLLTIAIVLTILGLLFLIALISTWF